jgi:hypothetical protein
MNRSGMKVLLLGENAKGSSYLLHRLEQRGCHCWFADSAEQGLVLLDAHEFDLVLITCSLHQASRMTAVLGRVNCSVFCCYPVEDGCWWVPLVSQGHKCLGAPALRPKEFVSMLDKMIREIVLSDVAAAVAPGA